MSNKSGQSDLVKSPYTKTHFVNQQQIDEFVACCNPVTGYLYFMDNFFYIQHPTKGSMVYHPWDYQKRLIHTYHNYRFSISLMPRQSGKCFGINTTVKIKNIHTGKVEEITIGKFYERFSNLSNLLNRADYSKWIPVTKSCRGKIQERSSTSASRMSELSESVERKFIESYEITDYEITTDTGWKPITHLHRTIPYNVWEIKTVTGLILQCADTHILFDGSMNQVFAKDLTIGSHIHTVNGIEKIKHIRETNNIENMFDLTIRDENHRFYSNGILSHNSTSAAGYLLWYAMFVPDSTILIAAHKYQGAQEIMQRIRYAYENCPNHIKAGVTTYNKGSLDFENGSRIVSATTTENTGRGMSITLLYLDEFAFVRPTIAEQFWTSITPTLSTGGKAIITSTPNSDEDQFALIWKGANKTEDEFGNITEVGINGFKAYRADWREQPGRDDKWAEEMKAQLGQDKFNREINCQFIIADETLINPNTLIMLEGIEPINRMGQIRWYKQPTKGNIYVVGLDPSLGTGGDPAAIEIFEADTTTQIGEWKHNKTDIPSQIKLLAEINKYIVERTNEPNNLYYSLENNSIGEAAIISLNEYGEANIPGIFISEPGKKRKGFNTTNKSKLAACAKFKTLLESKKLTIYSRSLISELKTFVASGGSYAAKIGDTDDLIMATLLIIRIFKLLSDYHVDLESQLRDHSEVKMPLPFFAVFG